MVVHAKQHGIKKIIARATTPDHIRILKAVGADEVFNPEETAARRMVQRRLSQSASATPFSRPISSKFILRKPYRPPADGSGRSYVPRNEQRHVLTLYPPPNKLPMTRVFIWRRRRPRGACSGKRATMMSPAVSAKQAYILLHVWSTRDLFRRIPRRIRWGLSHFSPAQREGPARICEHFDTQSITPGGRIMRRCEHYTRDI